MISINFGNRISTQSWTRALSEFPHRIDSKQAWDATFLSQSIEIDLSSAGFADFVVLGKILVFINAVISSGSTVTVRMPTGELMPDEQAYFADDQTQQRSAHATTLATFSRRRRQRDQCRLFLQQAGFDAALKTGPWPSSNLNIVESHMAAAVGAAAVGAVSVNAAAVNAAAVSAASEYAEQGTTVVTVIPDESPEPPHRLRQIVPYQWIPALRSDELRDSKYLAEFESSLTALGLPSVDAAALTQCVLLELIANVAEHAADPGGAPPVALVGGTLIQPGKYALRVDDYDPGLSRILGWGAECGSPLLRLLVADAGRGLAASLGPRKRAHSDRRSQASGSRVTDSQDTILYALERWSTSADLQSGSRACGLWKVERLIRSYSGGILISTGSDVAGTIFTGVPGPRTVAHRLSAWLPGTTVECDVLTSVPDILGPPSGLAAPVDHVGRQVARLACTVAPIASRDGFRSSDLRKIQETLQELPDEKASGLVIFADALAASSPLTDADLLDALNHIFAMASESANPATVALIFSGVNHKFLTLAVEEFNTRHETPDNVDVINIPNPILIITPHNRHYWIGGSPQFRLLLGKLSETTVPIPLAELFPSEPEPAISMRLRQLRDQTALVEVRSGFVDLRLRPQDALDALGRDLGKRIRDAYASAPGPGVEKGLFLTSSLRVTTSWSDPNEILRHDGSERLAGFLLASLVERRLFIDQRDVVPPVIVKAGNAGRALLNTFSLSLGASGEYFESVEYLRLEVFGSGTPSQQRIVICTDLISSGFSLYHVILELARYGLKADAVAVVCDARDPRDSFGEPDDFRFEDYSLPLVSLATVPISERARNAAEENLIPIDTILGRPIYETPPQPRHLKDQDSYIKALIATRAARMGHIRRPVDRHYSAYVDATLLFRDSQWAADVMWISQNKIERRHYLIFGTQGNSPSICVMYPTGTSDQISDVARALGSGLQERDLNVSGVLGIQRDAVGSRWVFPTSIELPAGARHVVILDSGMSSGHTVQQLTRLAVGAGASLVTVIILLDALNVADALALQQISAVRRHGVTQEQAGDIGQASFALYFIAGTAVNSNSTRKCSICALRNRYANFDYPMPERLEAHRTWLVRSLQVRPKERVFQEEPTDLLGMFIGQEDCVQYLQWKASLRSATSNTLARLEVVNQVKELIDDPAMTVNRDALIRLLVAEGHLLDVAPLWFPDVRADIGKLALRVLQGDQAMSVDPMLRLQAAILLAVNSPGEMVRNVGPLIRDSRDNEHVMCQILLEAQLMLSSAESGSLPDSMTDDLVRGLGSLEDELTQSQAAWPSTEPSPVEEIRSLVGLGKRLQKRAPESPQEAWAELRSYRSSIRDHTYDAAMWRVQLRVENLARGFAPRDPESVRLDWGSCQDFLCFEVLPNLEQVRPILLAKSVLRGLRTDELQLWTRVVNGDGPMLLDELGGRLERAFASNGADTAVRAAQAGLQDDLRWWNRFFLAANVSANDTGEVQPRGAFLAELINRCPAYLIRVIREVFDGSDADIKVVDLTEDEALRVFCDTQLLRDALSHIRINAEQRHRLSGTDQEFLITLERREPNHVVIQILNTDSEASAAGGQRGLKRVNAELRRFGATLESIKGFEPPWTYGIVVCLERWIEV